MDSAPPRVSASPVPSSDQHQRVTLLEILGYSGIAAGLFGTFAVLAETGEDAENTVMVTSLVLAAVFLLAGAVIGVDAPDRLARMRSACWFASVVGFAVFVGLALEPSDRGGYAFLFAVSAVYALVLWVFSPRLLQLLAFFVLALNTVAVLVGFPNLGGFVFGPPDLTGIAWTYWVGGALWFALGYLGLVQPPRSAMVIGMVFGSEGLLLLSQDAPELSAVLILASSAACLSLGGSRQDRAVTGVAVVGLIIGVLGLLGAVEAEGTGPGLVTMFVGVVLLGAAVWTARSTGSSGARSPFGAITSPFGRPKQTRSLEPQPPPSASDGTDL
ncbi:MAG: hypothetical protein M3138_07050 [Actinomycetota bacterium]|nr:hypothetical protein [Actinomycetota bacterium]